MREVTVDIILSNSSDQPFYQQIKSQIKQAILRGTLREGELLPSIRNLANELQVSVLTIRRVYSELESEGFISSHTGRGTFVSTIDSELIRESMRHLVEQDLQKVIQDAKAYDISQAEIIDMIRVLFEEDL
jgi:GntR family transcriptional regulator